MSRVANKEYVDAVISDMIADFLYYDRKEDDILPRGKIEEMVANGEFTVDEMIEMFREHLTKGLK